MKRALRYFLFPALALALAGCATSSDLKAVRSELNQQMEAKLASLDTRLDSRFAALQKEQEKNVTALASMRKGHANTTADFAELREQIQQLRGQIESLKKEVARDKDDPYKEKIDNLLLKVNFIENFLEISRKDSPTDVDASAQSKDPGAKQDKAAQYASAYQTFKNGNYTKAREAFQSFLAAYPAGEYSDNAQFWIGECYFFEKKYEKAILEYEKVTKKFPSSNKVPYALLKQGISFQNLGDKVSAKLLLQQVTKDYPNTSQARIARSKLQEIK
ncbi:MAG: tol-pal system protein YbgF [Deltaproteobacteria bacterium]|nr:tol-pal system protein YbgF [Deltaproteobacteria bacterium]